MANAGNVADLAAKPSLPAMLRAETDIVIADIGAMLLDDHAPEYARLLDAGAARIVGFEPDAREHARLAEKYPAPHKLHRAFVGEVGPTTYHETATTMTGSLYEPNAALIANYGGLSALMRLVARHPVEMRTLDAVLGDNDLDMIKIDVQGGELDVFKGALEALTNAVVIQTEVEFAEFYKNQPLFGDVDRFLNDAGFQFLAFLGFFGRAPIAPGEVRAPARLPATQVLWADAIYVPNIERFRDISAQKLIKFGCIAHTLSGAKDIAWRALAEVDGRDGGRRARDFADHLKVS